jgi:hypothetical protein
MAKLLLPLSGFFADKGVGLLLLTVTENQKNSLMSSIEGVHDWYRFLTFYFPSFN